MKKLYDNYSIAIPAYGDSLHLDQCISSLINQINPNNLLICTSTPSKYLEHTCSKYGLDLYINPNRKSIGDDWNFALSCAGNRWVTLAHQDDIYLPNYVSTICDLIKKNQDAILIIPWFKEFSDNKIRKTNLTHAVKIMLIYRAFLWKEKITTRKQKIRLLALGNPISCGGIALNNCANEISFDITFDFVLDWLTWIKLCDLERAFVFHRKPLMLRRIHADSATSKCMDTGKRQKEEREIFDLMWPKPIAKLLSLVYRISYFSNRTAI